MSGDSKKRRKRKGNQGPKKVDRNPASDPPDFRLTDSDGEEHDYYVTPHPPTESVNLTADLVAASVGPLAEFLTSSDFAEIFQGDNVATAFANLELEHLQEFDWQRIATSLQSAVDGLDVGELIFQLLSYTDRDGMPLGNRENFNDAYRYQDSLNEMYRAAFEAAKVNGFFGSILTRIENNMEETEPDEQPEESEAEQAIGAD